MANIHGYPMVWKLCPDDLKWLKSVSSANEILLQFSWNQHLDTDNAN
jgi:hypothetical protein